MKTTSYEISKKLAEAGFKSDSDHFWSIRPSGKLDFYNSTELEMMGNYWHSENFPAYDLETIIEALPQKIIVKGISYYFDLEHCAVCYETGETGNNYDLIFYTQQESNESLADLAAILLLKLHKEGFIKFDEVKK